MYITKSVIKAAEGIGLATVMFMVAVFGLAVFAEKSDTSVVKNKIAEAFRISEIQYPGGWNVNDRRGIDTFTDCLALQVSSLYRQQFPMDTFDSRVYSSTHHACDELFSALTQPVLATSIEESSYFRYWWGSAIAARIALGMTRLSVGRYRQLLQILSFIALGAFILTFFYSFGRTAAVFLPLFLSILVGYGMLTFGQSIAHAPGFIAGLAMLSAYSLGNVQRRSRPTRALWYSFLGAVCVYFDLLNGNVVAIEILLCCQIIAPYASRLMTGQKALSPTPHAILKEIMENSAFVLIGGFLAIIIRVVGYSFASHTDILDAISAWLSDLSYRVSGNLNDKYPNQNIHPSLHRVFTALNATRDQPFHGFLSKRLADVFYSLGFVSWIASLPLCWALHKKGVPYVGALLGFISAASLVPAWYLLLEQHTIVHAWMTGRLISLFCGLGMSLALLLGVSILRKP
jgi:hypothetical protein